MDPTGMANDVRVLTQEFDADDDDPTVIASRLGIDVIAVHRQWLVGSHGEYSRVDDRPLIYVDARLEGAAFAAIVAHELGHAICDRYGFAIFDEEVWCVAFAEILSRRASHLFPVPFSQNSEVVHAAAERQDLSPLELGLVSLAAAS